MSLRKAMSRGAQTKRWGCICIRMHLHPDAETHGVMEPFLSMPTHKHILHPAYIYVFFIFFQHAENMCH